MRLSQRHWAFIFFFVTLLILWVEKAYLQGQATKTRRFHELRSKQNHQNELLELASEMDGFVANPKVEEGNEDVEKGSSATPPTQTPTPPPATPTPTATNNKPPHHLNLNTPCPSKPKCPNPVLHPSKWSEKFGWGIRKQFPKCPLYITRFSSMEETDGGKTATVRILGCQSKEDAHLLVFDEFEDSHFQRMQSTMDAEVRQNTLRREFEIEALRSRARRVTVPHDSGVVSGLREPYIVAVCGDKFELHVRSPRKDIPESSTEPPPFNVLHLMFDSTSLPALRRGGKKLMQWMEELNERKDSPSEVFTFKHYHAVSCCSPGNQIPMYSGVMNGEGDYFVRSEPYQTSKNWLWNIAKEQGFTTFWSLDNCPDKSARDYHAYPSVDVRVVAPLCLAGVLLSHRDATCLGGRTVDEHVLNGLSSFWSNYHDRKKFAAVQLITPHEETEKLLIELDELVTPFLKQLEHDGTLNNTVVVFWSDHGINFGRYASTSDGEIEKMFPFVHMIMPRWLTATEEGRAMAAALHSNQDKLTTPYDMYHIVRRLLYYPSAAPEYKVDPRNPPLPLPSQSHIVSSLPKLSPVPDLMSATLDDERTCTQANIPMEFCTCIAWTETHEERYKGLLDTALKAHENYLRPHGALCHPVEFDRVESLELQKWPTEYHPKDQAHAKSIWMKPKRDMVKIRYWTKGAGKGLFEAVISVSPENVDVHEVALLTRLDAMQKKCGIINKVVEILCVCK
eukprot:PhM_4_TR14708/c0_g1_i1/m.56147